MSKQKPETNSATNDKSSEAQKPPARRQRRSPIGPLAAAALLVALVALAGSAYTWWHTRDVVARANQVPALRHTIASQKSALADLQQQLDGIGDKLATVGEFQSNLDRLDRQTKGALADLNAQLSTFSSTTGRAISRLRKNVGEPRAGAHIADAAYLLRVARHQARIRHDPAAMRDALSGARNALAGMTDPAAKALRQQIATALAKIGEGRNNPGDAAAQKLATLASGVSELPLKMPSVATQSKQPGPSTESGHWWQRIGAGLASAFDELVTVRRVGQDVQPLLAPEQRWFLYRNLSLQLDAARIAALQGDADMYRAGVKRAHTWIEQYFDRDNADVSDALATLAQLHDTRLQPALPDLSDAFNALARLRRQADTQS